MSTRRLLAITAAVLLLSGCTAVNGPEDADPTPTASPEAASPTPTPTPESPIPPSTAVDAALFFVADWREGVSFVSPSGNLSCGIYSDGGVLDMWGCTARERDWEFPSANPGDPCYEAAQVEMGCGDGIVVTPAYQGDVPHPLSRGGAEFADEGGFATRTLQYGESVTYLTVTCASTSEHVICADLSTGHGLVISRDENTIF
jgi:hypothetical protein